MESDAQILFVPVRIRPILIVTGVGILAAGGLLLSALLPSTSPARQPIPGNAGAELAGYDYGVRQGITAYVNPQGTGYQLAQSLCRAGSLKVEGRSLLDQPLATDFSAGCMRVYFRFLLPGRPPSVRRVGSWAFYDPKVTCSRSENLVTAAGHWTAVGTGIMWSPGVNRRYGFIFEETLRIYSRSHAGSWVLVPSVGMGMSSDGGNSSWTVQTQIQRPVTGPIQCQVSAARAPTPGDWFG
jgi:hypothetical protein